MPTHDPGYDALRREIIARFEGLDQRITETREDAREARDAATKLTERLASQDVPAQMAKLQSELAAGFIAHRSDLVNAADKITREFREADAKIISDAKLKGDGHDARIAALESFRQRIEGASGLVGWMAKNTSWLITVLFAVVAAVGLKEKLP